MLNPNQLHKDAILSNLSVQYRNNDMIWPLVMPIVKVNKRSDIYYVYTKADSYRLADDKMGATGLANELSLSLGTDNYSVKDHALADWVPQALIENSDNPLQPEVDTNDFLNKCLDTAQEKRVADLIFAAGSYPIGNKMQLTGNDKWGGSTDDPCGNIMTAIETCFERANTIIFGQETWTVFRKLPEVLDAVKSSSRSQTTPGGFATIAEVMSLFEVDQILIGRRKYNTAKEGQTASYSKLWGKHFAALYVEKKPGIKSITFGATLCESVKSTVKAFDEKRGIKGSIYIRPAWNSDEKIIASDCGYFIEDAVA